MNRVVIIGNGFDLAHKLKTKYIDFLIWYWKCRELRLGQTNGQCDQDDLCSIYNLNESWGEYYFNHKISINNDVNGEIINAILNDSINFKVHFKSKFFEHINDLQREVGWVDIENEYYQFLNKRENIESLNLEFEYIKTLLREYLAFIQVTQIDSTIINSKITNQIFSPIQATEIAVKSQNKWIEFLHSRVQFLDSDWKSLLEGYHIQYDNSTIKSLNMIHTKDISLMANSHNSENNFCKYFLLPENILILNFNYTSTIDLYVPNNSERIKINHIHGDITKPENLIFGYGDELDKSYQTILDFNENEYFKNIKSIRYLESYCYRDMLSFIESSPYQIFIMGHSCGNSDRTLLNTLFEHENCVSIKPFYHKIDDKNDNYLDIIQNINRNFTDPRLMRDRVINKTFCEFLPQNHD